MVTSLRAGLCGVLTLCALNMGLPAAASDAKPQMKLDPEVAVILAKSTTAYKSMKSYRHSAVLTLVGRSSSGTIRNERVFMLALQRPNRFRFSSDTSASAVAVCNGKTFINYKADLREYTQTRAPASYEGINIVDDVVFQPMATYVIALMLQGNALADADVREAFQKASVRATVHSGRESWKVVVAPFRSAAPFAFYFNTRSFHIDKVVLQLAEPRITLTETLKDIRIDRPVPASVFQYTLPAGARRVAHFSASPLASLEQMLGKPAPDFELKDLKGKGVRLSNFKGKFVVLHFWDALALEAVDALRPLQALNTQFADKDVVTLVVDTANTRADLSGFLQKHPEFTLPILLDPAEKNFPASVAYRLYNVRPLPTTYFLDRDGTVRQIVVGANPAPVYSKALEDIGVDVGVDSR